MIADVCAGLSGLEVGRVFSRLSCSFFVLSVPFNSSIILLDDFKTIDVLFPLVASAFGVHIRIIIVFFSLYKQWVSDMNDANMGYNMI